jgi:hypothetical protein
LNHTDKILFDQENLTSGSSRSTALWFNPIRLGIGLRGTYFMTFLKDWRIQDF